MRLSARRHQGRVSAAKETVTDSSCISAVSTRVNSAAIRSTLRQLVISRLTRLTVSRKRHGVR